VNNRLCQEGLSHCCCHGSRPQSRTLTLCQISLDVTAGNTYLESGLGGAGCDAVSQDSIANGGLGAPEGDPPLTAQHVGITAGGSSMGIGGAVGPHLAEARALCHGPAPPHSSPYCCLLDSKGFNVTNCSGQNLCRTSDPQQHPPTAAQLHFSCVPCSSRHTPIPHTSVMQKCVVKSPVRCRLHQRLQN